MTYSEKYKSLDWSKVPAKAKSILEGMKEDSNNFRDKEAMKAIGPAFDKVYDKVAAMGAVKSSGPAPKSAPAKAKAAAKASVTKPAAGSHTPKVKAPSSADINSLAKTIRKSEESWSEARARAKKMITSQQPAAAKQYGKAYSKLRAMLEKDKQLARAMKGVDAVKDATIPAHKPGKRTSRKGWKNQYGPSKGGRVYWENRANRADFKKRTKYPLLEHGGEIPKKKTITDERGNTFYLTYDDSTHFFSSMDKDKKGASYHIGEWRGYPYYNEVHEWLKECTRKEMEEKGYMAKGGITKSQREQVANLNYMIQNMDDGWKKNNPEKAQAMIDKLHSMRKKYGFDSKQYAKGGVISHKHKAD